MKTEFVVMENRGYNIIYDYVVCESERSVSTIANAMNILAENPEKGLMNGDGNPYNYYVEKR